MAALATSTFVLGEIQKGVGRVRSRDPGKAAALERWLRDVRVAFNGRLLGTDDAVADQWGIMHAIRRVPVIDGLLAATALTHGLALVTRNARGVAGLGATLLNPFEDAGHEQAELMRISIELDPLSKARSEPRSCEARMRVTASGNSIVL